MQMQIESKLDQSIKNIEFICFDNFLLLLLLFFQVKKKQQQQKRINRTAK